MSANFSFLSLSHTHTHSGSSSVFHIPASPPSSHSDPSLLSSSSFSLSSQPSLLYWEERSHSCLSFYSLSFLFLPPQAVSGLRGGRDRREVEVRGWGWSGLLLMSEEGLMRALGVFSTAPLHRQMTGEKHEGRGGGVKRGWEKLGRKIRFWMGKEKGEKEGGGGYEGEGRGECGCEGA